MFDFFCSGLHAGITTVPRLTCPWKTQTLHRLKCWCERGDTIGLMPSSSNPRVQTRSPLGKPELALPLFFILTPAYIFGDFAISPWRLVWYLVSFRSSTPLTVVKTAIMFQDITMIPWTLKPFLEFSALLEVWSQQRRDIHTLDQRLLNYTGQTVDVVCLFIYAYVLNDDSMTSLWAGAVSSQNTQWSWNLSKYCTCWVGIYLP